MVIPDVSRYKIVEALKVFDQQYRNSPEFIGWESRGTQRYAIVHNGKLYPPKMIISLAAGISRRDFTGGNQSNSYLANPGFKIIHLLKEELKTAKEASVAYEIEEKQAEELFKWGSEAEAKFTDKEYLSLACEFYSLQLKWPRYNHISDSNCLPKNGIYLFFEKGEKVDQRVERIVRVGTHKADKRFRGRIRQHYGNRSSLKGNKNASVFRKHVGGALLRRDSTRDERLDEWLRQGGRTYPDIEFRVSECLRDNFTFCCFSVEKQEDRLKFEKGIIALLAKHALGRPSADWLGKYAYEQKIGQSGLWNTQQLDAEPLSLEQFEQIKRMSN